MKFVTVLSLFLVALSAYAQTEQPDTIKSQQLQEVVVQADASIETGKKTILYPTKLEKHHSTNGYQLLANMNLPDLEVDANLKQISTISGQNVIVLINGVEALPDELATLAAADIISIDYQRNPGGKYAGQGAVMNFVTRQYDYGGNVYVNAEQGFTHLYGKYLGMVNYKHKAVGLSLTASADWDKVRGETKANNTFLFPEGALYQSISSTENKTDKNSQYARLKFTHAVNNHDFTAALSFNRNATPRLSMTDNVAYRGLYDFDSEQRRRSDEYALSPQLNIMYNLWLPQGQTINTNLSGSFAHARLHSLYDENGVGAIANNTRENNYSFDASFTYFKELPHSITIGLNAAEWYKRFHDVYSGDFQGTQNLDNNFVQLLAVYQQSLPCGLYYYANAGASNLVSRINGASDSNWQPVAYYGANYAINGRHSLSFDGIYVHSVYDPSYKNDAVIRTSFFQATIGNPNLKPFKCSQNTISYNGRVDKLKMTASYSFMKYFDNCNYRYFIEDYTVFKQLVNDGSFSFHKVSIGLTYNLFDNRLSIGGNGLFAYNRFDSKTRPDDKCILRGSLNATYFLGNWRFKAVYAPQRKAMSWDGEHFIDPSQYGLTVNWQHGNWAAEFRIMNFLSRYQGPKQSADYGCYVTSSTNLTNTYGRNISVSMTYTLPYGKKTDKDSPEPQTTINSAILRPF